MEDKFWAYFAIGNTVMFVIYLLMAYAQQQSRLNEALERLHRIEEMLRQELSHELVEDEADVLEKCLDFTLTTDTGQIKPESK